MYSFTKDTAVTVLDKLKEDGYIIDLGLSNAEVGSVEKAFNASLPADLKVFLQVGIMKGHKHIDPTRLAHLPDWRNPDKEAARCKDWIEQHAFRFDIERNGYWYKGFGKKPTDLEEAVEQAFGVVRSWPPLFPIYGHRFMSSDPPEAGNPVLSVWQASDTVYYGMNLLEYMNKEFRLGLDIAGGAEKPIPYWGDAFDLDQTWQPMRPPISDPR